MHTNNVKVSEIKADKSKMPPPVSKSVIVNCGERETAVKFSNSGGLLIKKLLRE